MWVFYDWDIDFFRVFTPDNDYSAFKKRWQKRLRMYQRLNFSVVTASYILENTPTLLSTGNTTQQDSSSADALTQKIQNY